MVFRNDPNGYIAADFNYIEHLENGGRYKEQSDIFTNQAKLIINPLEGWNINAELNTRINSDWYHRDVKPVYAHDADDLEGLSSETMHLAFGLHGLGSQPGRGGCGGLHNGPVEGAGQPMQGQGCGQDILWPEHVCGKG